MLSFPIVTRYFHFHIARLIVVSKRMKKNFSSFLYFKAFEIFLAGPKQRKPRSRVRELFYKAV